MPTIKAKAVAIKDHVYSNRAKYAAAATLAVCATAHVLTAKEWNAFLEKHGLTAEYYAEDPAVES